MHLEPDLRKGAMLAVRNVQHSATQILQAVAKATDRATAERKAQAIEEAHETVLALIAAVIEADGHTACVSGGLLRPMAKIRPRNSGILFPTRAVRSNSQNGIHQRNDRSTQPNRSHSEPARRRSVVGGSEYCRRLFGTALPAFS